MVFHEKPIKSMDTLAYVMGYIAFIYSSSANKRVLRLRHKNKRITCILGTTTAKTVSVSGFKILHSAYDKVL